MKAERDETLSLVEEAVVAGARLRVACAEAGLDVRTVQRWRRRAEGDLRRGPKTKPRNALSPQQRARVLETVNSIEFRDLSPKQIVPTLADRGEYVASESTMYRVLHEVGQDAHRGKARPRTVARPEEVLATAPCQLWTWDITYLRSAVRGRFFYLYMFVDVWSRRIMRAEVHESECNELAAHALRAAVTEHAVCPDMLTLHSDNGSPMKGSTMLATLRALGVVPSFSRPSVSDDNPFSEAVFRTLKYTPAFPRRPFASLDAARAWVERFVHWYNHSHLHSAIGFVSPHARHVGADVSQLLRRRTVYEAARALHPERWSGPTRRWDAPAEVALNPRDLSTRARASTSLRCGAGATTSSAPRHQPLAGATSMRRLCESAAA